MHICKTESLCRIAESSTTLYINHIFQFKKIYIEREREKIKTFQKRRLA